MSLSSPICELAEERGGGRAFLECPLPGVQGDLCITSGCPEPGSSLELSGLSAGWRFRFRRKLAQGGTGRAGAGSQRGMRALKAKIRLPGGEICRGESAAWAEAGGNRISSPPAAAQAPFVEGPAPAQTGAGEQ